MSSSSCPPPPAQARKWQPVKELKADKLVEGATTTMFTIWKRRMYDYLALPDISADHYPTTKEVIPYINASLEGWWYGRMEGILSNSISVKEKFDKIQLEVSALDPVINRRDRLLSMRQEKGVDLASSFVEQLERLGKQADMASFNGEALLCRLVACASWN